MGRGERGEGEEEREEWRVREHGAMSATAASSGTWNNHKEEEEEEEDSSDDDSPSGLPGTTPPAGSRYMKSFRKHHKYKSGKKLSLGHIPKHQYRDVHRRPRSMMGLFETLEEEEEKGGHNRRNTVPSMSVGKGRREGHKREPREKGKRRSWGGGGSSGGYLSPHPSDDKSLKKKKKQNQRKISKERDDKQARSPRQTAPQSPRQPASLSPRQPTPPPSAHKSRRPHPLEPVQSVDLPDYSPSNYMYNHPEHFSPSALLTTSLQPGYFQPLRSVSAGNSYDYDPEQKRIYRSYSDAQFSLPPSMLSMEPAQQKRSVRCPPDRKQFFRNFTKALKYSGISRPQRQAVDTPHGLHVPRHLSESLGLENPSGFVMDALWKELQAYIHNRQPEEQDQWLHYNQERVSKVLYQVRGREGEGG